MAASIPAAADGFIPTLNAMGFMTTGLDPVSQAFVDFTPQAPGPALEIGAAYGVASIAALKKGAHVIANDLDERHLQLLKQHTPPECLPNLTLAPGAFPENLSLAPNSLGAVLACRILHFLSGEQITLGMRKFFDWLKPGGKCFIVAETPYLRTMQPIIPIYEERVRQGKKWPGYFDNIQDYLSEELKSKLPTMVHWLDPDVLRRVSLEAGFEIEKIATMPRPDFPAWTQWDGRESVGAILVKP